MEHFPDLTFHPKMRIAFKRFVRYKHFNLYVNDEEAKSFRVLGLYNPFLPSLIFAGRAERID
jgi:hypothetical protein